MKRSSQFTLNAESLALAAMEWLAGSARNTEAGLTWAATPSDDEVDATLYNGAAGIVLTLLEAQRHFRDDRYGDAALRGARAIAAVDQEQRCSLYFGLTGMAVALHAVHTGLGDAPAAGAARRALDRVRSRCDRYVELAQSLEFATVLVDDLVARAWIDAGGARWSNHEHRRTPSALEPRTGWAMGNAGIVRELLRFARASAGADPTYAVCWPDHPAAAPRTGRRP